MATAAQLHCPFPQTGGKAPFLGPKTIKKTPFFQLCMRRNHDNRYSYKPLRVASEKVVGIDLGATNSAVAATEPTTVTNAQRIVDSLADSFKKDESIDLLKDKQALQRLTESAEKAKIELSSLTQTNISLPFITATADGPKHIETTLARAKFEDLCSDLTDRLDKVILVGGSTRIPVQDLVKKMRGLDFTKDDENVNSQPLAETDVRGRVVSWSLAGTCGFKDTRRGTPFAAQTTTANAILRTVDQGMQRAEVMIKGPGLGSDTALRAIRRSRGGSTKKNTRKIPKGVIHVQASFNNTIVTVTDVRGQVVSWASAGSCGFKGTRRGTPFAAQTAAANAIRSVVDQGMQRAEVMIKGPGFGRDAALRAIRRSGILLTFVRDVTPLPHNGCRPPKGRRV